MQREYNTRTFKHLQQVLISYGGLYKNLREVKYLWVYFPVNAVSAERVKTEVDLVEPFQSCGWEINDGSAVHPDDALFLVLL